MLALTQCWFSRIHLPERRRHAESDGSLTCHCRYCGKKIVSWNKETWHLAEGFNITHLAETVGTRFLYIVDTLDDMVIARFPVAHLEGEEAIRAYGLELKIIHKVDEPDSGLVLRDSRND